MDAAIKGSRRIPFSKIASALKEVLQKNVDIVDGELSLPDRYVIFMSSWDRRREGGEEAVLLDELTYELLEAGEKLGVRKNQSQLKIEIRTDEALPQGELKIEYVSQPLGKEQEGRRGDPREGALLREKAEDTDIPVQPAEGTGRKRILIVDDSEDMRHLLSETLKVLQYDYAEAKDGVEAICLLSKEPFDLVISDIRMPRMSGLRLLQIAKAHIPHLPVILITGYRPSRTEEAALRTRADGYLTKPFTLMDLKREIDGVLGAKGEG